jgi:hypothetical protein
MKKVFSDVSHIAHLWANQLQSEARNSGNFYFNVETIYSYGSHFPIARHVKNKNGEQGVLFTERRYSNTTAKHISVVRQAASHLNIIYCYRPDNTHSDNFKAWVNQIESIAANLPKAKKPEKYLNEIGIVESRVKKYAEFFELTIPESLVAAMSIASKDQFTKYADRKKEYELSEKKRQEAELKKRHKKELNEWLKGKTHRLYVRDGFDYLRLSNDRIETTQAAQVPFELGKKLFLKIKDGKLNIGDKVMDFEVQETSPYIKIGCHTFKPKYLLDFGSKIFTA